VATGRNRRLQAVDGLIERLTAEGVVDQGFARIETSGEAAGCLTVRTDGSFVASYPTPLAAYTASGLPGVRFGNGGSVPVSQVRKDTCRGSLRLRSTQTRDRQILSARSSAWPSAP